EQLDGFELNLFAAKPDRSAALAREGLLVEDVPDGAVSAGDEARALSLLRELPFAAAFGSAFDSWSTVDPEDRGGLAAYAVWHDLQLPLAMRCAALARAVDMMRAASARTPTVTRLATFARAACEWGRRGEAVPALRSLLDTVRVRISRFAEPF